MDKGKILWLKKPSKKFILYYSFLRFDSKAYRRHDITAIPSAIQNAPLLFTIILLVIILAPFLGYFYSTFIANEKPRIFWDVAFLVGTILAIPLIIFAIYNTLLRNSCQYVITDRGVELTGGIFTKISKEVLFSQITDVRISQNFLERLLGIYELHIQTAGSRFEEPEISFLGIDDPYTPRNIILQYTQRVQNRYSE